MNKDWTIEQLRELFSAFGYPHHHGKRLYLDGESYTIHEMSLNQPAFVSYHSGKVLEINATDTYGNRHEIKLYTSDWPEKLRK